MGAERFESYILADPLIVCPIYLPDAAFTQFAQYLVAAGKDL